MGGSSGAAAAAAAITAKKEEEGAEEEEGEGAEDEGEDYDYDYDAEGAEEEEGRDRCVGVRVVWQHEYPLEPRNVGQGGVMKLLECPGTRQKHCCFFRRATATEVRPILDPLWPHTN